MKVKKLTEELLNIMLQEQGIKIEEESSKNSVMTSKYVANFNRGVAHRINNLEINRIISASNPKLKQKIR